MDILGDKFKPQPYWWDDIDFGAQKTTDSPEIPSKTDVLIVGAGYAGLHAAIVLARAGSNVLVVDAEHIGYGASTRNGGMISSGVNVGKHVKLDSEIEAAMLDEASQSYSWLAEFVKAEKIDAVYQQCGRFVGAHSKSAYKKLAGRLDKLNDLTAADAYMVAPEDTRQEIASDYYHGGMVLQRSGAVHPGKLYDGVLKVARKAGVTIVGQVRAGKINRRNGQLFVETSAGEVQAENVLITTNGYTGGFEPWLKRRVVPVPSYQIATEPLGKEAIKARFPNLRMIADTKRLLYYFRPSPDRTRILFGGRAHYLAHDPYAGARMLHKGLTTVFPELADIRLSHGWWGYVAYTMDGVPHIGESQKGVYHAVGCHGSGVVMMSWLGHRLGMRLAGTANSKSIFEDRKLSFFPFYNGQPWFLPIMGKFYQFQDWLDVRAR